MSEPILIATVSTLGVIVGAAIAALASIIIDRQERDLKSSDLLIEAQTHLAETLSDSQLLWQWNRQLIDHIYRGDPPPPPKPPHGLFEHDHITR